MSGNGVLEQLTLLGSGVMSKIGYKLWWCVQYRDYAGEETELEYLRTLSLVIEIS